MSTPSPDEVTRLVVAAREGNDTAKDVLFCLVYDELRELARKHLQVERPDHTLDPTALVHEAYLRLARPEGEDWVNRGHFFAACATAIRRILVEHARGRRRRKRGGGWRRVPLSASALASEASTIEMIALDAALTRLTRLDPPRAKVVELRFFGGMTVEEAAAFLGVSVPTVVRYWRLAKAWLYRELNGRDTGDTEAMGRNH